MVFQRDCVSQEFVISKRKIKKWCRIDTRKLSIVPLCYCTLSLVSLCFFDYQWYPQHIMLITTVTLLKFLSLSCRYFKNQPLSVCYLFPLALPFPSSLILSFYVFIIKLLGWVNHCWSSYKAFSSSLLLFFPLVSSLILPLCFSVHATCYVVWVLALNFVIDGAIVLIFRLKFCDH